MLSCVVPCGVWIVPVCSVPLCVACGVLLVFCHDEPENSSSTDLQALQCGAGDDIFSAVLNKLPCDPRVACGVCGLCVVR